MTSPDDVSVFIGAMPVAAPSFVQMVATSATICLGLINISWTAYLAFIGRRRSVEDEFWFRKVIAPAVIDRSLGFSNKWGAKVQRAEKITDKASREMLAECKSEAQEILTSCVCLKLYGQKHYKSATSSIDEMVDEITEALHLLTKIGADGIGPLLERKRASLGVATVKLLSCMKNLQKSF